MFSMSMRIRQARVAARLSQAELARRLGVQRSAVTQWERDSGTHPNISHLAHIACETQVHFEWLATGRGERSPPNAAFEIAIVLDDYARDDLESRALIGLRRFNGRRREAIVKVIELLAGG